MNITCEREMGTWTIRINGIFVADFWRAAKALKVVEQLRKALQLNA